MNLKEIEQRLALYEAPIVPPADYTPGCTCGSLVPECGACGEVRSAYEEKRQDFLRTAAQDMTDLVAEVKRLRRDGAEWKRRAEQHGCDVENGDPDCG